MQCVSKCASSPTRSTATNALPAHTALAPRFSLLKQGCVGAGETQTATQRLCTLLTDRRCSSSHTTPIKPKEKAHRAESNWSSQTLMDTCLGMLGSGLKFVWTNPTEMLVSTGSVVEQFDVV